VIEMIAAKSRTIQADPNGNRTNFPPIVNRACAASWELQRAKTPVAGLSGWPLRRVPYSAPLTFGSKVETIRGKNVF